MIKDVFIAIIKYYIDQVALGLYNLLVCVFTDEEFITKAFAILMMAILLLVVMIITILQG